jgi:hypothetical protein
MMLSRFALALVVLVAGCSSSAVPPPLDAGAPDAAPEASAPSPDTLTPDLSLADAAADAAPDSAPDATADAQPDAGTVPIAEGFALHECEGGVGTTPICGTWVWLERAGASFSADWSNGAHASIALVENGSRVVLRRVDPSGASSGLTADYVGAVSGERKLSGTVTWMDKGQSWSGVWSADW